MRPSEQSTSRSLLQDTLRDAEIAARLEYAERRIAACALAVKYQSAAALIRGTKGSEDGRCGESFLTSGSMPEARAPFL